VRDFIFAIHFKKDSVAQLVEQMTLNHLGNHSQTLIHPMFQRLSNSICIFFARLVVKKCNFCLVILSE